MQTQQKKRRLLVSIRKSYIWTSVRHKVTWENDIVYFYFFTCITFSVLIKVKGLVDNFFVAKGK